VKTALCISISVAFARAAVMSATEVLRAILLALGSPQSAPPRPALAPP
jgi:hypothetical protein